ncbi:hypothetical protein TRIUR3_30658 [Triticum urartu]|uniref:Uncharacterized protein n=1 Tax=Triticum urartu TaxID=4572 RepID=M7YLT7_TRIUA|nr:hypothetical protein TRIUR3_30658 [Triticum urartu]
MASARPSPAKTGGSLAGSSPLFHLSSSGAPSVDVKVLVSVISPFLEQPRAGHRTDDSECNEGEMPMFVPAPETVTTTRGKDGEEKTEKDVDMRNSRKWKRKKVLMMVIIRISSLTTMMIGTKRRKYSFEEILLFLHGTTGLNMLQQAKEFNDIQIPVLDLKYTTTKLADLNPVSDLLKKDCCTSAFGLAYNADTTWTLKEVVLTAKLSLLFQLEVSDNIDERYTIPLRPEGNIKGCHRQQRSTSSSPSGRRWRSNVSPSSADLSFSYSHLIIVTDTATLRIVQLLYFQIYVQILF